jgi:Domain of unknown function (DUF6484)
VETFAAIPLEVVTARPRITGNRIGKVTEINANGAPLVDFPGNPFEPRQARWTASLSTAVLERACREAQPVLLIFEDNDPVRPVIVDVVLSAGTVVPTKPVALTPEAHQSIDPATAGVFRAAFKLAHIIGIEDGFVIAEPVGTPGVTLRASATVPLRNLKDQVLLLQADEYAFVVIGQLMPKVCLQGEGDDNAELLIKGEYVRIEAGSMLTLKSGNCTLELDARGRAVLVGDQIVTRARLSNKVQGGSIQLN